MEEHSLCSGRNRRHAVAMQANCWRVLEEANRAVSGADNDQSECFACWLPHIRNWKNSSSKMLSRRGSISPHLCLSLTLPALNERKEDFPERWRHFARQVAAQNGWKEKFRHRSPIDELRKYGLGPENVATAQRGGNAHSAGFRTEM